MSVFMLISGLWEALASVAVFNFVVEFLAFVWFFVILIQHRRNSVSTTPTSSKAVNRKLCLLIAMLVVYQYGVMGVYALRMHFILLYIFVLFSLPTNGPNLVYFLVTFALRRHPILQIRLFGGLAFTVIVQTLLITSAVHAEAVADKTGQGMGVFFGPPFVVLLAGPVGFLVTHLFLYQRRRYIEINWRSGADGCNKR